MKWSTISEFPDYMVSDDGQVKSLKTNTVLTPWKTNSGYLMIHLRDINGKKYNRYIHRLVAEAFYGNDKLRLEVNHIDGNKLNNRASNLEWCTHSENTRHAIKNGLFTPYKLPLNPHPCKKVKILELDMVFDSVSSCADYIGTSVQNVSKCSRGVVKTCCGYHIEEV